MTLLMIILGNLLAWFTFGAVMSGRWDNEIDELEDRFMRWLP